MGDYVIFADSQGLTSGRRGCGRISFPRHLESSRDLPLTGHGRNHALGPMSKMYWRSDTLYTDKWKDK